MIILLIAYIALGYWATGKTIYANKIVIEYKPGAFFMRRCCMGAVLGWILIPAAILKSIASR